MKIKKINKLYSLNLTVAIINIAGVMLGHEYVTDGKWCLISIIIIGLSHFLHAKAQSDSENEHLICGCYIIMRSTFGLGATAVITLSLILLNGYFWLNETLSSVLDYIVPITCIFWAALTLIGMKKNGFSFFYTR